MNVSRFLVDTGPGAEGGTLVYSGGVGALVRGARQLLGTGAVDIFLDAVARYNAAGTSQIQHGIYADRGHSAGAGKKTPVTDAVGAGFDLTAGPTGTQGLTYDPNGRYLQPLGTDSMNTGQQAVLGNPHAGAGKALILLSQMNQNGNTSYEWGVQTATNGGLWHMTPPSTDHTHALEGTLNFNNGDGNCAPKIETHNDGGLHLLVIECGTWVGSLYTPGFTYNFTRASIDGDLMACLRGNAVSDATLKLILGQDPTSFDGPGLWKHRAALPVTNGLPNAAQWVILKQWAQAEGVVFSSVPGVFLSGNSWVAAIHVSGPGLLGPLWDAFGTRAQFSNFGISGAVAGMLQDRFPVAEARAYSTSTRSRKVAVYLEAINGIGQTPSVGLGTTIFNNDKAAVEALVALGATHVVFATMPYESLASETERQSYNTQVRNYCAAHGYLVWDIGGGTSPFKDASWLGGIYDNGNAHPNELGYSAQLGPQLAGVLAPIIP